MAAETRTHPRPRHEIAYEQAMNNGEFDRFSNGTLLVILGDEFIGTGKTIDEIMLLPQVRDPNRKSAPVIYTWTTPTISFQPYRDIR